MLIVLAVIMGYSQGNLTQEFWIRLSVSLTGFGLIMFVAMPRFARWFLSKLESEKYSHYIFVLSILFFSAFLAQVAGVEPIIGAFVAGLALNPLIPHSSALMNRIEFIGNSLFIPFFLISVGMIVDVSVVFNGVSAWIVAGTLTVVALAGKWIAAFITQLLFRYSKSQRQLIFGLSSSHAAATLAIILVGFNAGILDENVLNGTIILVLVTCVVGSFVTERASRGILTSGAGDEYADGPGDQSAAQHIMISIADYSRIERLLEFAMLVKEKRAASPITILTIVPNDEEAEKNILAVKKAVEPVIKLAAAAENRLNVITSIDHNVAGGINRVSREIMANVVLLGWPRQSGLLDKLIGEKMQTLLHSSNKEILLCNFTRPMFSITRVLVFVPALSENEPGFSSWVHLMDKLAVELTKPLLFCCNSKTESAIRNYIRKNSSAASISFYEFKDWVDFLVLARIIREDDLLILVSARNGDVSYINSLESIPAKLDKHFSGNSRIVLYPQQNLSNNPYERYMDASAEPITKGIETIRQVGKGIGKIFGSGNEKSS